MATDVVLKKVRLSVSNAVHSLAVLVARDEGLLRDQGLDVELARRYATPSSSTPSRTCTTPAGWTSSVSVNGAS
jgi:hypothetical protein